MPYGDFVNVSLYAVYKLIYLLILLTCIMHCYWLTIVYLMYELCICQFPIKKISLLFREGTGTSYRDAGSVRQRSRVVRGRKLTSWASLWATGFQRRCQLDDPMSSAGEMTLTGAWQPVLQSSCTAAEWCVSVTTRKQCWLLRQRSQWPARNERIIIKALRAKVCTV